jgi:hypothetical protein
MTMTKFRSSMMKRPMGLVVAYVVDGAPVFFGTPAYVTPDGWVGIRQVDGIINEAPIALVEVDPT